MPSFDLKFDWLLESSTRPSDSCAACRAGRRRYIEVMKTPARNRTETSYYHLGLDGKKLEPCEDQTTKEHVPWQSPKSPATSGATTAK